MSRGPPLSLRVGDGPSTSPGDSYGLSVYWPAAVEGCQIDGAVHGLPKDISDHVVYLNTGLFEAAGVALPADEWTWNEVRETAQALTDADHQRGLAINS